MDIQFEILCCLSEHGEFMPYVDLLNAMPSGGVYTKPQLVEMRRAGLVSGSLRAGSSVRLEAPGRALLLQLRKDRCAAEAERLKQLVKEQAAESIRLAERAEDIACGERRHKEQKMVTLTVAVISCVATGVVSFFSGIALAYVLHVFGL